MEKQSTASLYVSCKDNFDVSDCSQFRKPQLPKQKSPKAAKHYANTSNELLMEMDSSWCFDRTPTTAFKELAFLSGRPSLLFDDGRESLGILPQFKLPVGNKLNNYVELERDDSFLVSTERQLDPFINIGRPSLLYDGNGRESLGIQPQLKNDFKQRDDTLAELESFFVGLGSKSKSCPSYINKSPESLAFLHDSASNEASDFQPDIRDISDDNYSVYVEANFLASKMADNSILDISQEGGTILDRTPQPDLVEDEDSLNTSDAIIDTERIYRQVDLMLPASSSNGEHIEGCNQPKKLSVILKHLSSLISQQDNTQVRQILHNAMKEISELINKSTVSASIADEEDSGRSSTENEKELRDCNAVLDLSLKANHTSEDRALDLSFAKDCAPRRLSITFSHNDDSSLPAKQPSNNLKQQTMHMRQLWSSNDSKTSSNGSMKVKLKPKKSEADILKRGPLKAVVPLASLDTSVTTDRGLPPQSQGKPMAQSTPEERTGGERRKMAAIGSPLARPQRTTPIVQRAKKMSVLNRPNAFASKTTQIPAVDKSKRILCRGKSSVDLKPQAGADGHKKLALRRSYSVGGKENVSIQQSHKLRESTTQTRSEQSTFTKLPQKNIGMKSVKINEKLCKN